MSLALKNREGAAAPEPTHPAVARRGRQLAGIQLAVLLLMTFLIERLDLDCKTAALFYDPVNGWYLAEAPVFRWIYAFGPLPGLIVSLAALMAYLAGFFKETLRSWQQPCLVVVLTAAIAGGLLVNSVLKQYWGRPRPEQIVAFGGNWDYRPIFPPDTPGKGSSFPSGHGAMGFVLLALGGFGRKNKRLAAGGIGAGIVLGGLLSLTRMVQGDHFLSDTIWSLGIVLMTFTVLHTHLRPPIDTGHAVGSNESVCSRRIKFAAALAGFLVIVALLLLRPFYKTMVYSPFPSADAFDGVHIHINAEPRQVQVVYSQIPFGKLRVDIHGYGAVDSNYRIGFDLKLNGRVLEIFLRSEPRSYFVTLKHALTLTLPEQRADSIEVRVNDRRALTGKVDCGG